MSAQQPPTEQARNDKRLASLAYFIPSLMLAGPISGWLMGWLVNRYFPISEAWEPRVYIICIVLGVVTSMREVFRILKRIAKNS